jgi:NRAMP (natural resistance-associated macrophage protein)-like metal ion transporter
MKTWWRRWRIRIFMILAILGPGFITANVDNDSGGIMTYSNAGAQFGYSLLWTLIPITLALIVVQEMCARMGAVTGKGLSDLIREEFGLRITFLLLVLLVIVNYGNVVSEFAGIASSMELFHISKYLSVPVCAALVWVLVVKGDYKVVEKVFLCASVIYISYIIAGVKAGPNWHDALLQTVKLPARSAWSQKGYVYTMVAVIGTTISPWMQFYLQSSLVDKGTTIKNYAKSTRIDVIVGSFFTDIVGWFIVVACGATLFVHSPGPINDAADAASAMLPMAGQYAFILFAAGLFNASLFAASILPLSTAYTVCEGLGVESGLDKKWKDAPFFYWFYTLLIALGAAVVLLPNFPYVKVIILSQVLNGVLLPLVMMFMLQLINKHELMGKYTNTNWFNWLAWGTAAIVIGLTLILLWQQVTGG